MAPLRVSFLLILGRGFRVLFVTIGSEVGCTFVGGLGVGEII